jgi:nitrous-oxide reductase
MNLKQHLVWIMAAAVTSTSFQACKPKGAGGALSGNAAERVYVAPGEHDEFYTFTSGGFSGQMTVYGLPSGRLLKQIPVFSVNPENAWGFSEETKPMLQTSHGFVPWDDLHHIESSFTDGMPDGRWIFANSNNTPRLARIDLTTFSTAEIIEIPNTGGNHCSPFTTENSEYVIAATRFSVPPDGPEGDVPIDSYKENFTGHISFVSVDKETGEFDIAFQLKTPGLNFDLSSAGKGISNGWLFISCYNSEQAHTLLEVNASQNDKDFIMAINWKKAEEYFKAGKGKKQTNVRYAHNKFDEKTHTATSEMKTEVTVLDVADFDDLAYLIPCPKSPHGADVSPTGEFIVGSGKLAALIPVFSFEKLQTAIKNSDFEGERYGGIPVVNYESALHGEVQKPGLGPLHTEFDEKGNAYTSFFVSSEVVKWDLKSLEVLDRQPTYYSVGHLMVAGGNSKKPYGKYLVAYNKITKDRFLPTGPELAHSAQLFDISGDKMELLLDFPTLGEPHYAQALPADLVKERSLKIFDINANEQYGSVQ